MSDSSLDTDDSHDVDVKHEVQRLQRQVSKLKRIQSNLQRTLLLAKDEEIRKLKQDGHKKDNDVTAALKSKQETIDALHRKLSSFIPKYPPTFENHHTAAGTNADDFEKREALLGYDPYGTSRAPPPSTSRNRRNTQNAEGVKGRTAKKAPRRG